MIQINGRFLTQLATGVQRYAIEVVSRFETLLQSEAIASRQPVTLITPGGVGKLESYQEITHQPTKMARGHLWEQLLLPLYSRGGLLWSPCNVGPLAHPRHVVTIHDVAVLDHPEWFDRKFAAWYGYLLPRLVQRAQKILTDSQYSKERIVFRTQVDPAKIEVIPLGVNAIFAPASIDNKQNWRAAFELPEKYLLFVGTLEPRKNLVRLLKAWELAAGQLMDVHLLIAGGSWKSFGSAGFDQLPPRSRLLGYFNHEDLPILYNCALGFIYPSLYEGFGLPPLEAMACGTPVIASATTSLPEVVGDAAITVEPEQVEEIAAAIIALAGDEALRAGLSERGLQRAQQFSWERTACQTWQVLKETARQAAGNKQ
jgi:glycosyltransferase involved in cell wall biosynthesis